jgi:hypothetical protein
MKRKLYRYRWSDNIQINLRNLGCEWTGFNSLIKVSMVYLMQKYNVFNNSPMFYTGFTDIQ